MLNYYIDESGNTGDVLSTGNDFDFSGQPIFSLACVGVDQTEKLDEFICELKSKYKIQGKELKSTKIYRKKPDFILDLIRFLGKENIPIFIEVVDKKYFISANIVNCHVLPAYSSPPETIFSQKARNDYADFIYYNAPNSVFYKFINACKFPSIETLLESFNEIQSFVKGYFPSNEFSVFLLKNIEESVKDLDKLKIINQKEAHLMFIPIPDSSKKGKSIWMLPNLSSFTSIYARINQYLDGEIANASIIHDEQAHFDEIISINKKLLEGLNMENSIVTRTAKYAFSDSASLQFSESHEYGAIQVADILAGLAMRYVQEKIDGTNSNDKIIAAYNQILRISDPRRGAGVNLVTTSKIHRELHF
mgnify:CR=1 FL=1|tara:strand:+ start:240 stop:1328 length:1089 start_codon:yes stop_codon:yes gene_type:complete